MTHATSTNMESLPKQFVSAMRTLFDIMDDKHTGYVKLTDIENRWRDDRTKGLPSGVIESLQKVASHDGYLTFDRFCTGLKICLIKNQVQNSSSKAERHNKDEVENRDTNIQLNVQIHRPPSAPLLDVNDTHQNLERNWDVRKSTDNASQHRTVSMPQLIGRKDPPHFNQELRHHVAVSSMTKNEATQIVYGPPKPPRLEKNPTVTKQKSRTSFKTEEEGIFANEEVLDGKIDYEEIARSVQEHSRGLGDGRPANESQKRTSRRREPRRHTLHNGVDYNMLKRMKQIEQEKDVFLSGLNAVEEAREWYLKQLAEVQEKMRYAGRMGAYVEPWSEAQQERLELLRARVLELNRQLGALAAGGGWRRGPLSLHINLALPSASRSAAASLAGSGSGAGSGAPTKAGSLKSQNLMLAEEVNRKNERISILEREKSALIRELLLQRNRSKLLENYS